MYNIYCFLKATNLLIFNYLQILKQLFKNCKILHHLNLQKYKIKRV